MRKARSQNASAAAPCRVVVSAIISTCNRSHFLSIALDSLLAQTRPVDEIIVVDDASTDDTAAVLESYSDRVRVVQRTANAGKPAALNLVIPQARGDYLWLFDDDDVALPDALENQLAYLQSRPDIDFSYSDKYIFAADGDIWDRAHWTIDPLPDLSAERFLVRTMLSMNTLLQGMLIPARCLVAVGPFDETLQRCEDHEMLLRLALHYNAGNMGRPTFVYRQHEGVRGAGANRHDASVRYRVMLDYRRKVFRQVREHFPLNSYLIDARQCSEPAPGTREYALAMLQRSCVMFRHGLVGEALADLETALHDERIRQAQTPSTQLALSQALDIETWTWPFWPRDLFRLGRVVQRHRTSTAGRYLARGIYWNTRRAWQDKAHGQALLSAAQLAYFLALSSAARLLPGARSS